MDRRTQRGEGKFGVVVSLLLLAGLGYAAWNGLPAYIDNWQLKDKMTELARAPRGTMSDEKILDQIDRYLREEGLTEYVTRGMFRINTLEGHRTISVIYDRPVKFLPGFERAIRFNNSVEQTILF